MALQFDVPVILQKLDSNMLSIGIIAQLYTYLETLDSLGVGEYQMKLKIHGPHSEHSKKEIENVEEQLEIEKNSFTYNTTEDAIKIGAEQKNTDLNHTHDEATTNGAEPIGDESTKSKSRFKTEKIFYQIAKKIINGKFTTITDIIEHKKDFLQLPLKGIQVILKNQQFQRDSENSILTMIMMWINHDKPEREKHLVKLLEMVDFTSFTKHYLINLVPQVYTELTDQKVKEVYHGLYIKALEDKNKYQREPVEFKYKRAPFYVSASEKFAMKVEFRKISNWAVGEKYYSQPIFSNGYSFYFFMRVEKTSSDQSQYLAGYLRCTSEVTQNHSTHFLPVKVTFELVTNNNQTNKLPPVSVIFDHFDRSIGSRMSTAPWEKIRAGETEFVNRDKITVIISVEFTDSALTKQP